MKAQQDVQKVSLEGSCLLVS